MLLIHNQENSETNYNFLIDKMKNDKEFAKYAKEVASKAKVDNMAVLSLEQMVNTWNAYFEKGPAPVIAKPLESTPVKVEKKVEAVKKEKPADENQLTLF